MAARDVTVGPLVQHLPAAAMAHSQPQPPYYAIRTRRPAERSSTSSVDSTCSSGIAEAPPATHDISRVSYHVKQLDSFAQTLEAVRTSSSFDSRHMSRFPPPSLLTSYSPPAGPSPTGAVPPSGTKTSRPSSYTGRRTTCSSCQSSKTSRPASARTTASRRTSLPYPPTTPTWTS